MRGNKGSSVNVIAAKKRDKEWKISFGKRSITDQPFFINNGQIY